MFLLTVGILLLKHSVITYKEIHYILTAVTFLTRTGLTDGCTNFPKSGSHLKFLGALMVT
jgi:hypothetical protein